MHADPIKPKLKPPGTKRLKVKIDILLSTSAFTFNWCRYNQEVLHVLDNEIPRLSANIDAIINGFSSLWQMLATLALCGQGFHSSTSLLNLSRFCH